MAHTNPLSVQFRPNLPTQRQQAARSSRSRCYRLGRSKRIHSKGDVAEPRKFTGCVKNRVSLARGFLEKPALPLVRSGGRFRFGLTFLAGSRRQVVKYNQENIFATAVLRNS